MIYYSNTNTDPDHYKELIRISKVNGFESDPAAS